MSGVDAADPVRAQYEAYPYPPRDPRDEAKRMIVGSPSHLREVDHWILTLALNAQRKYKSH